MCNCIKSFIENGLTQWELITEVSANLNLVPQKPGVYVLRTSNKGEYYRDEFQRYLNEIKKIHETKKAFFHMFGLTWKPHRDLESVKQRVNRIIRIQQNAEQSCSILYIGSSKDLRQRLCQLLCEEDRHTVEHPVRALLLNGWQIECAWKSTPVYKEEEEQLKAFFGKEHSGALPPLVDR